MVNLICSVQGIFITQFPNQVKKTIGLQKNVCPYPICNNFEILTFITWKHIGKPSRPKLQTMYVKPPISYQLFSMEINGRKLVISRKQLRELSADKNVAPRKYEWKCLNFLKQIHISLSLPSNYFFTCGTLVSILYSHFRNFNFIRIMLLQQPCSTEYPVYLAVTFIEGAL